MVKPIKQKLSFLDLNLNKNTNNLATSKNSSFLFTKGSEFISRQKTIYHSDWQACTIEDIPEASTRTIETLLPQKASFSYSFNLNIPESYLPFLQINLLTKTIPEQQIKIVDEFTYNALTEVRLQLYRWWGTTNMTGIGKISDGKPPEIPPPAELYDVELEYMELGGEPGVRWVYDFIPEPTEYYPVPETRDIPGGQLDWRTPEFPNNYWEAQGVSTFNNLIVNYGYTYQEAKTAIHQYYPDILITDESDGPPWFAYDVTNKDTVEIAEKNVFINKRSDNNFKINVSGHFLLISKSITETENSDPSYPTYKPQGEDLYVQLKVFFNNPLQSNSDKRFSK